MNKLKQFSIVHISFSEEHPVRSFIMMCCSSVCCIGLLDYDVGLFTVFILFFCILHRCLHVTCEEVFFYLATGVI
jgi:hypothetical protein